MLSAKVVVGEIQGQRRMMIGPTLAECVCQSCESSIAGSHAQIVALNIARAYLVHIGRSHDHFFSCASAFSRNKRAREASAVGVLAEPRIKPFGYHLRVKRATLFQTLPNQTSCAKGIENENVAPGPSFGVAQRRP